MRYAEKILFNMTKNSRAPTLYFESEESGWNHLALLDARDGKIRGLTSGAVK